MTPQSLRSQTPSITGSISGPSLFKDTMDASVVTISDNFVNPSSWKVSESIASYNTYSRRGNANHYFNKRGVQMGDNLKAQSTIKKSTDLGAINVKGIVYDDVTPVITSLEIWAGEIAGKEFADAAEKGIKYAVPKKYKNKNDGTWDENSDAWSEYKSIHGYSGKPMHMRDENDRPGFGTLIGSTPLNETVENFGDQLKVTQVGPNLYEISGLDIEFIGSPYVWFHENGYVTNGAIKGAYVPPRPFIAPGVNEAMAYATGLVMNRNPITSKRKPKTMVYEMGSVSQFEMQNKSSMQDFLRFIWWFMPQISEWQYLAYAHDALGYMSGHFMSKDTLKNFATALAAGKVGQTTGIPVTGKLMRRSSRKAMWGTDTVSITGG